MTANTQPTKPHGFTAHHVLTSTIASYGAALLFRLVLLAIFAAADVIFIKTTVDVVLNESEGVSWFVAIALTIGSISMMLKAGFIYRSAAAQGTSTRWALGLVGAWAVLGLALVLMRFNAAAWTVTSATVSGQVDAVDDTAKHQGIALLLALMYISAGVLAFFEGKHVFNPVAQAYLLGTRRRRILATSIAIQRGVVNRGAEDLERARGNLAALPTARAAADAALYRIAADLMAEARIRIANSIGDPAATGITELELKHDELKENDQ